MSRLDGKIVLITGAANGIGAAAFMAHDVTSEEEWIAVTDQARAVHDRNVG